jgi:hypothetical protein
LPVFPDPERKQLREEAEAEWEAARPKLDAGLLEDEPDTGAVLEYVRRVAKWQIETIEQMTKNKTASYDAQARARDARTLNELVRTLERLDALEKNRKLSGRRTKTKHDAELKAALVRRLDKLVAASRARDAAGRTERG